MTRDAAMKGFILLSAVLAAALFAASGALDRSKTEAGLTAKFAEGAIAGEAVYAARCSACHGRYDPRFNLYADWKRIVESRGCPRADARLGGDEAKAVLGYLAYSAAGSEDEAQKMRILERKARRSEAEAEGLDVFLSRCRECHGHPLYTRTRTQKEWSAAMNAGLESLHGESKADVLLGLREKHSLAAHLAASAACGPADAKIFRILIGKGAGAIDFEPDDEFSEVRWAHDYEKALTQAAEKRVPLLLNLTIEGGT